MVLKPKRQLWVPSKPAIIVPNRRPIPVVRPPIIPARRIIPITASVGFDATSATPLDTGNLTSTSLSGTLITVGASATALAVALNFSFTTQPTGISVTWDSGGTNQAMSAVTGASGIQGTDSSFVAWYWLLNPTAGNKTLAISWTNTCGLVAGATSFTGAASFQNGTHNTGNSTTASVTIASAVGNMTVGTYCNVGAATFSSTSSTQDWIVNNTTTSLDAASNHTAGSASNTMTASLGSDFWNAAGFDIVASTGAVVEEYNSQFPRRYWVGWTPNASLLRNTAQDFSSPGVETNPHWRPWTRPAQWNPLAALRQNAAVDVPPVVTPDTPPPFKPSSWPLQWSRDWRLFRTTAQDFSSFGVETNPHWINRPWPVQWAPLSLLRATPNDAPAPIPPDTPPHWQGKPWPIQWNLLLALRQTPADDVPPVTPETNTFFTPRTFPLQWLLQPSLRQTTAQDFSFLGVATSVHLIPRMWPLQWSLQASLMRGTAQDFSTTPPATNPVYARYGAAHGIGMLSAIPGEIPS